MIDKTIHYCWFGNNPKPKLIKKCIESWKKFLPDWEVIEWNESNYDVNKNAYIREAYAARKWAFVCDYARFDILNTYGGIFLDTDVEFLRPIPEEMLLNEAFCGFESNGRVAPGLIFGAVKNQKLLKEIMDVYATKSFGAKTEDGRIENIVDIVTSILNQKGLNHDNSYQIIDGVAIYPKETFCCFNHEIQTFETTPDTVSIHHYYASWSPWYRKAYFRAIKIAARLLGKERYLRIKRKIKK